MNSYFAAIAEKDADAFRLFEDNKRMRLLVQQTLQAREEQSVHLRSTQLLVATLETELQEKTRLVEAQEQENVALRDGVAALRVVLCRPSELDFRMEDLVEEVTALLEELKRLRQGAKYAQWCCAEWERWSLAETADQERRGRHLIEMAAEMPRRAFAAQQQCLMDACAASTMAVRLEAELVEAEERRRRELEAQSHDHTSKQQRTADESNRLRQRCDELQLRCNDLTEEAATSAKIATGEQEALSVCLGVAGQVMSLLSDRACAAEEGWCSAVQQLRRFGKDYAALQQHHRLLEDQHEKVLQVSEEGSLRVARLQKRLSKEESMKAEVEDLQQTNATLRDEIHSLRKKWSQSAAKERTLRLQCNAKDAEVAEQIQTLESNFQSAQRKIAALESRLQSSEEEGMAQRREAAQLHKSVDDLRGTEAALRVAETRLLHSERYMANLRQSIEKADVMQAEQRRRDTEAHELVLHRMSEERKKDMEELRERCEQEAKDAQAGIELAMAELTDENSRLRGEIEAWIRDLDGQKKKVAELQSRLDREQAARQVLEQQQREESALMRSFVHRSAEEVPQTHTTPLLASETRMVQKRNRLLEEACRRSAAVIAELREALHRGKMEVRSLRNSVNVSASF